MRHYIGLRAIAERMGTTPRTLVRWKDTQGFLMYGRSLRGGTPRWYTNDNLIAAWECSRALATERVGFSSPRAAGRNGHKGSATPPTATAEPQHDAPEPEPQQEQEPSP